MSRPKDEVEAHDSTYVSGWVDGIRAALDVLENLCDRAEAESDGASLAALRDAREKIEALEAP